MNAGKDFSHPRPGGYSGFRPPAKKAAGKGKCPEKTSGGVNKASAEFCFARKRVPLRRILRIRMETLARTTRIVVKTADGDVITGTKAGDGGGAVSVALGKSNRRSAGDESYLLPLVHPGSQINLVNASNDGGTLCPELVVYEPDFLVDISFLASLFTEFGPSPLYALVRRLSPSFPNKYRLLGDFAGQLLDEAVHGDGDRPYAASVSDFCRDHCLDMAACADLEEFHSRAKEQKANIHRALGEDWDGAVNTPYDASRIILEPSFVCEKLGLQGRMDFLQDDLRVVMEQKSGKADNWRNRDFTIPVSKTDHAVQLLLYRALLHYGFGIPEESILSCLLYSKYFHPLARIAPSPELLFRAMKLRNQIVAADLSYGDAGFGALDTLSADDLNVNHSGGPLWEKYQKPDFEKTLASYREASPLEKAYCKRMLQFVQKEYVRSKTGTPGKPTSGACGRWTATLGEKKEAGDILYDMSVTADAGHVLCEGVEFGASNFRTGDVVTLFQYDTAGEPDCRKSMIHRATIEEMGADFVRLRLRMPQRSTSVFDTLPRHAWAMEHDFMDSSYAGLWRGVYAFLSAPKRRRDLVLAGAVPETDPQAVLNGDYGSFNDLQLKVKRAKELFLIIGPPGSGKTSYGMLYTLMEELSCPGTSVAVMAYTNRAVDEICSKLGEEGIDFVRTGSELSCAPEFRSHMLGGRVAAIPKLDRVREYIEKQRVFVGTIHSFASRPSLFLIKRFSLAIIDEASQILEPQIAGILASGHEGAEAIGKFVFIGDYKQLPAVVRQTAGESAVNDPLLNAAGITDCRMSLFERLVRRHGNNPDVVATLTRQGRMHEDIARLSNELFYRGMLSCVPLPHQREPSATPRAVFIDVAPPDETPSPTFNAAEAGVIAGIVAGLDKKLSVGIIVPYRNQISAVRKALAGLPDLSERDITTDTVERFQGSQREVIIYGFTVREKAQMAFLTENSFSEDGKVIDRKLNVVITRARRYLYLVGNRRLLEGNPLFREIINNYLDI